MSNQVILAVNSNRGYAADQIETRITLADMLAAVEDAIQLWGEDAVIVTRDNDNRYGASFGSLAAPWGELAFEIEKDADGEDEW